MKVQNSLAIYCGDITISYIPSDRFYIWKYGRYQFRFLTWLLIVGPQNQHSTKVLKHPWPGAGRMAAAVPEALRMAGQK